MESLPVMGQSRSGPAHVDGRAPAPAAISDRPFSLGGRSDAGAEYCGTRFCRDVPAARLRPGRANWFSAGAEIIQLDFGEARACAASFPFAGGIDFAMVLLSSA